MRFFNASCVVARAIFTVVLSVATLGLAALARAAEGTTDAGSAIPIASLQTILVATDAHPTDRQVAELLCDRLEKLYGVKAALKTGAPDGATSGILVGRPSGSARRNWRPSRPVVLSFEPTPVG